MRVKKDFVGQGGRDGDHVLRGAWVGRNVFFANCRETGLSPFVFLLIVTAVVVRIAELSRSTATAAALPPVLATIAAGNGMDVRVLAAAAAVRRIARSCRSGGSAERNRAGC